MEDLVQLANKVNKVNKVILVQLVLKVLPEAVVQMERLVTKEHKVQKVI